MGVWIKKVGHRHSAIKKDILPAVTTRMDLEGTMINEVSKTEKDKYCMILLTCGIEKQANKLADLILMDTENILVVAREGG